MPLLTDGQKGKGMKFSRTKRQKKSFWHHMHGKGVKILGLSHSKTEPAPPLPFPAVAQQNWYPLWF